MGRFSRNLEAILLVIIIGSPLLIFHTIFNDYTRYPQYFAEIGILVFIIFHVCSLVVQKRPISGSINAADGMIILFVIFLGLHLILTHSPKFLVREFISILLAASFFFTIKKRFNQAGYACNEALLQTALLIIALIESWLGIFQAIGYRVYFESSFSVSGSFDNPGPFSNFLVCLLPVALGGFLYREKKLDYLKQLSLITAFSIVIVLILAKERTAWIAGSACLVWMCYPLLKTRIANCGLINSSRKRLVSIFILLIVSAGFCYKIYLMKPDSVNGRILIYKISGFLVKDHYLTGIGIGRFSYYYNIYQSAYFARYPASPYSYLADNVQVAYCEYLQILVELGFVGLGLFLLGLYFILKIPPRSPFSQVARSVVRVSLICALFSYPLQGLSNNIPLIIMLAVLSKDGGGWMFHFSRKAIMVSSVIISGFAIFQIFDNWQDINARISWKENYEGSMLIAPAVTLQNYKRIALKLHYDPYFLYNYGNYLTLNNNPLALSILLKSGQLISDNDLYENIGDVYLGLKEYQLAESFYLKSRFMIPSRFSARYKLFKLYQETGQDRKIFDAAFAIDSLKIKIPSDRVIEIKREIKFWLKKNR
jgi:O-antigen polymerase